jgi:hypothetical protein
VPLAKDNCCFASVVSRYLQQILDGFIQFEIEPVESGLDLEVLAQPSPAFLELGTVKAFKCRKRVILLESNSSPCTLLALLAIIYLSLFRRQRKTRSGCHWMTCFMEDELLLAYSPVFVVYKYY